MSKTPASQKETGTRPESLPGKMPDQRPSTSIAVALALVAALTAAAVWWLPPGPWRQLPTFLLLWAWPALSWALLFDGSPAARFLSGSALAILLNALFALALHHLPGPIPRAALLVAALVTVVAPLPWAIRRPSIPLTLHTLPSLRTIRQAARPPYVLTASLIFLVALILRLPGLGYKELQGDEGIILVRAAAALSGDDAELFLHQKGPAEILLPLFTWRLTGAINEFWSRLPFTWAAWLGIAAVFLLARRWFGRRAAVAAGLLYAVGGFGVAFARIVQYQSLVVLWSLIALLHATRYCQNRPRRAGDLVLATVFLAGGLLAHYDAVLAAPAAVVLLLAGLHGAQDQRRRALLSVGVAGAAAAAILALFYVPYVLSPTFSDTAGYLLQDRLGGSLFSWSFPHVWQMMTFYNSIYYVLGLSLLALPGIAFVLGPLWHRSSGKAIAIAALLYLIVPFLFYTVIVADPRTHVYTIFPGASLIAGAGAAAIWRRVSAPGRRAAAGAIFLTLIAVSAFYVYLLFIDATPERQRTWSQNRPGGFPTTWEAPPRYGLFGFPYQAGWRLVPNLVDVWPYASNEEREVTDWYMAHAPRTHCANFETFIWAENVQDPVPFDAALLDDLYLHHLITVNGRPTIRIYQRGAIAAVTRHEASGADLWRVVEEMVPPERTGRHPLDVTLEEKVRLLGYDLDTAQAHPGGQVVVTLYWQALTPFTHNYQTFAHLYNGETLLAQHDSAPECAVNPTTLWEPGEIIADPHVIPLPAGASPGETLLFVGMYDLITGERLSVPGADADLVYLTDVSLSKEE